MTATNHVLTGAVIVSVVPNPVLGLTLALLSHFVLDALPHFGRLKWAHNDRQFFVALATDCFLAASVLVVLCLTQPTNWVLLVAGGIVAASPDLMWFPLWLNDIRHIPNRPLNRLEQFHSKIQWGERPWGYLIEIPYGVVMALILHSVAW